MDVTGVVQRTGCNLPRGLHRAFPQSTVHPPLQWTVFPHLFSFFGSPRPTPYRPALTTPRPPARNRAEELRTVSLCVGRLFIVSRRAAGCCQGIFLLRKFFGTFEFDLFKGRGNMKTKGLRKPVLLLAAAALLGLASGGFAGAGSAFAATVITASGTGPGGVPISASATFTISGDDLTVMLQNTAPSNLGQDVPGSTLTGVFFDLTDSWVLTPWSATITAGSIVQGSSCSTSLCTSSQTNVGGEFGYQMTSFPGGADRGIASAGYLTTGLPGNIGNFGGVNLDDPNSLDGINFGIISAAVGFNPNGGLESRPLIRDTVTFLFHGATGLTYSDITDVSFQYGTAITEPNIPLIPEPEIYAMMAAGLGLMGFVARRRIRQAAAA